MQIRNKIEPGEEVIKETTLKQIISSDLTQIIFVFAIGIILTAVWSYYYQSIVVNMFPIVLSNDLVGQLFTFFVIIMLGFYFQTNYFYFLQYTFMLFHSIVIMIALIVIYIVFVYYLAVLVIEKISIHIRRTNTQKAVKMLALWFGIGTGIYLTIITFPTSNLFNFNYATWLLSDITNYVRNLFEFTFNLTALGLIIGYIFVFFVDMVFFIYHRVTKKTLIRGIADYEWTTKRELNIEKSINKVFKIKKPPKESKLSKAGKFGLIALILLISFFTFKLAISKNTTIHVRFSPNFVIMGDFHNMTSSMVYIYNIGMMTSSITPEKIALIMQNYDLSTYIRDIPFEMLGQSKYMMLNSWFVGGLDFTFELPKDHSFYFLVVSFFYRLNVTENWAMGKCIFFNYFPSSIIPKIITIDGLYLTNYNKASSTVYGYALSDISDGWLNVYDYLFSW